MFTRKLTRFFRMRPSLRETDGSKDRLDTVGEELLGPVSKEQRPI